MVRPMTDLGLHLADMAAWPEEGQRREWLRANDSFRRYVLDLLRDSGPLLSRDVPDRSVVRTRAAVAVHGQPDLGAPPPSSPFAGEAAETSRMPR